MRTFSLTLMTNRSEAIERKNERTTSPKQGKLNNLEMSNELRLNSVCSPLTFNRISQIEISFMKINCLGLRQFSFFFTLFNWLFAYFRNEGKTFYIVFIRINGPTLRYLSISIAVMCERATSWKHLTVIWLLFNIIVASRTHFSLLFCTAQILMLFNLFCRQNKETRQSKIFALLALSNFPWACNCFGPENMTAQNKKEKMRIINLIRG